MCKKCKCDVCDNGIDIAAWEKDKMETIGWFIHCVDGDNSVPYEFNCHTHGLMKTYNHPDLQIVLRLNPAIAQNILSSFVEQIKSGTQFQHGSLVNHIIRNFNVLLINAVEDGRNVLRIILPDKEGNLEPQEMTEVFSRQHCI
jgi:hypothetical protein